MDKHQQSAALERFIQHLRKQRKRATNERITVAKTVFMIRAAFTADSIVTAVSLMSDVRISRATIFRVLEYIQQSGLIVSDQDGSNGNPFFRHTTG